MKLHNAATKWWLFLFVLLMRNPGPRRVNAKLIKLVKGTGGFGAQLLSLQSLLSPSPPLAFLFNSAQSVTAS